MKKLIICLICLAISAVIAIGQEEGKITTVLGYYVTDSTWQEGILFLKENRIESMKRVVIPKQKRHQAKVFYPEDIEEYGLMKGPKYVSSTININGVEKKVFLEELVNIDDSVFIYNYLTDNKVEYFYYQEGQESSLQLIDTDLPEEFWTKIINLNRCNKFSEIGHFPKTITRKRIIVLNNAYNECNPNLFTKFQFGPVINAGMGIPKLKENPTYTYGADFAFGVGGFFQFPFDEFISLRTEILYSFLNNRHGKIDEFQKGPKTSRYIRNSVQMPLMIRYTFNSKPWENVPFMELGPCFDYSFLGAKFKDNRRQTPDKYSLTNEADVVIFQYGYSIGGGVERKIGIKRSLHLGIRYNWVTGARKDYVEKLQFLGVNIAMSL